MLCNSMELPCLECIASKFKNITPSQRCFVYYLLGTNKLLPLYKYALITLTDFYKMSDAYVINHIKLILLMYEINTSDLPEEQKDHQLLSRELILTLNELNYFPITHYTICDNKIYLNDCVYANIFNFDESIDIVDIAINDFDYIDDYKIIRSLLESYDYYMYRYLYLLELNPNILYK